MLICTARLSRKKAALAVILAGLLLCAVLLFSGQPPEEGPEPLITNDLRAADLEAWYAEILEKYPVVERNLSRVDKDLILNNYLYYGY